MKYSYLVIIISLTFPTLTSSQTTSEFEGKVRVKEMGLHNSADSLVVRLPDGTLGVREANTISSFQILTRSNDTLFLENGGFVKLPEDKVNDADSDNTNEIQTFILSLQGDTLFLSKANYVVIPNISLLNSGNRSFLFGGTNNDSGSSVDYSENNHYVVVGSSQSLISGDVSEPTNGSEDYWAIKFDSSGTIIWDRMLGGFLSSEFASSVVWTSDNGAILLGQTFYLFPDGDISNDSYGGRDLWVVRLDSLGEINWDKTLGGSGQEFASDIEQTSDGGFVVLGTSTSSNDGLVSGTNNGGNDIWVVKLDASGNKTWDKLLGGNSNDSGLNIEQTPDDGYIVAGYSLSSVNGDVTDINKGGNDFWILKLDSNGNKIWDKLLGGDKNDIISDIEQTSDGGYIIAGYSESSVNGDITGINNGSSDYWIVKLDGNGNKVWDKLIGGSQQEQTRAIVQTHDGGYVVTGYSGSSVDGDVSGITKGFFDIWIVKLDSNGNKIWDNLFGSSGYDYSNDIKQLPNGDLISIGSSNSSLDGDVPQGNGNTDYWIVILDTNGNIRE